MTRLIKRANPGGSTDNFESGMAQLARQTLQNRSPIAAKSEVGFQLMDKNDEGDEAVGVFGLRIGKQLAYVPAFFLNGEIKTEHLYVLDRDQFLPLSDKWVQALSKGQFSTMGRSITRQQTAKGLGYADLTPLLRTVHKTGGARLPDDLLAGLPKFAAAALRKTTEDELTPFPETVKRYGLPGLRKFASYCRAHPSFMGLVDRVYGEGTVEAIVKGGVELSKLGVISDRTGTYSKQAMHVAVRPTICELPQVRTVLTSITERFCKWAERNLGTRPEVAVNGQGAALHGVLPSVKAAAYDRRGKPGPLEELVEGPRKKKPKPVTNLAVISPEDITKAAELGIYTPEDVIKSAILKGIAVKDARELDETSKGIDAKSALETWINPPRAGVYQVLDGEGKLQRCAVLMHEISTGVRSHFCLVLKLEGGSPYSYQRVEILRVFAEDRDQDEATKELEEWIEGLGEGSLTKSEGDGSLTVLSPRGEYLVPFRVFDDMGDGVYNAQSRVSNNDPDERQYRHGFELYYDEDRHQNDYGEMILRKTDLPGTKTCFDGREFLVPNTAKVVRLGKRFALGRSQSMFGRLVEKTASLRLIRTGSNELSANGFRLDDQDMELHLANDWCLPHQRAEEMVKAADVHGTEYRIVPPADLLKNAYGPLDESQDNLVSAPSMPHYEEFGTQQLVDGRAVPVSYDNEHTIPSHTTMSQPQRYDSSEGGYGPSSMVDMEGMEEAAAGGRELFDVAALSPLMDAEREDSMIDDQLTDLFKGLDRTLRILFSLYRRYDVFVERYGDQDVRKLEDLLRVVANKTGELILDLRKKDADPMPNPAPSDLAAV